jgi:FkbM family methyltransferase
MTIDDLVSTISFNPDIIKMDVEGAEGKVIKGGMRYFKEKNTDFSNGISVCFTW